MNKSNYTALIIRTSNKTELDHNWVVVASWLKNHKPKDLILNYLDLFGANIVKFNDESFPEYELGITKIMYVSLFCDEKAQIGTLLSEEEFYL